MTDLSEKPVAAAADANANDTLNKTDRASYWKQMLKSYKKRNASLERRRSALEEKVRFMEYTLPSMLMGAAATVAYDDKREVSDGPSPNIPESSFRSVAQEN